MLFECNGFKVAYYYHPGSFATVRVVVNAGSCMEGIEAEHGAAHFLEHMFFKGTKNKSYQEVDRELSALGSSNAYTNFDKTVYHISCLNSKVEKAMTLLCELFFESRFDVAEFTKEQTVIQEEIQMYLDDPSSYFYDQVWESVFGEHNIAGTKRIIQQMTIDKLLNFKERFYNRDNVLFVIAGDVEKTQAEAIMSRVLAPYALPTAPRIVWEKKPLIWDNLECSHVSSQAMLSVAFKGWNLAESIKGEFADLLFHSALGQTSYSLLFQRIRQELGMCYSVFSASSIIGATPISYVGTMIDPKNIDLVQEEILKILKRVQQDGFPADLLDTAKSSLLYRLAKREETVEQVASQKFDKHFICDQSPEFHVKAKKIMSLTNDKMIEYAKFALSDAIKIAVMNRGKLES